MKQTVDHGHVAATVVLVLNALKFNFKHLVLLNYDATRCSEGTSTRSNYCIVVVFDPVSWLVLLVSVSII